MKLNLFQRDDVQVVTVAITGPPAGAIAVARALASVVPVASMRHTPDDTGPIQLHVVCHLTRGRRS